MSSAYAIILTGKENGSRRRSSTSRTPPCGHPRLTRLLRVCSFINRLTSLLERKLWMILIGYFGQARLARAEIMAGCQAESKALLRSRKAEADTFFPEKAPSMKEIRECAAVSVDLFSLKSC